MQIWTRIRNTKLTTWIFTALVIGLLLGQYFPDVAHAIKPFRTVFLNGIKCIIAPLIFASIVCGINSSGSVRALGRMGLKAIIWFEIATGLALVLGLLFVNMVRPGDGLSITATNGSAAADTSDFTWAHFVEHLLPTNFAEAIVHGEVLQIVLFSAIFGAALLLTGDRGKPVLDFCEGLMQVMFKFTEIILLMAPIGVGAALAGSVAEHGLSVLLPMGKMVLTLYVALLTYVLLVLVPALVWSRVRVRAFFKELRPTITLAFATTSSESAYPGALRSLEKMGVSNSIASFVLPLGYSFNLDGSTLYLATASIFIAQAAHIELSISQQVAMMLTLMVTSKGVAAVPRTSIVVLSATLAAFKLPLEGLVLIMGVDEFMDMARTTVNLLGNCVATTVVSHVEGEKLAPEFRS